MSLLTTLSDIIPNIMSFLEDKDNTCLVRTCNNLYKHSKKYGFVNFIKGDLNTNMMTFIQRFSDHSHSVNSIELSYLDDPHIWLPHYVEKLFFDHCAITEYVNPPNRSNSQVVKYFKLTDYNRYKFKTTLRINWNCFPNLEELELYVYDVDLVGIDKCRNLKRRKINICKKI
jgi:hypothetical protein